MRADLEILARELEDLAERGELPDGGDVLSDGSIWVWAQGWLLTFAELGIYPAASSDDGKHERQT